MLIPWFFALLLSTSISLGAAPADDPWTGVKEQAVAQFLGQQGDLFMQTRDHHAPMATQESGASQFLLESLRLLAERHLIDPKYAVAVRVVDQHTFVAKISFRIEGAAAPVTMNVEFELPRPKHPDVPA